MAHARLLELGDAEVDHTWMLHLNPHHGAVREPEEFVDSVRLRLCCVGPCELVPCASCQFGSLGTPPAALWVKPRAAAKRSPHLCMLRFRLANALLRLVLGLIPGTDPTSSPPPLATPTLPSTSRLLSARPAGWVRLQTDQARGQTRLLTSPLSSASIFFTPIASNTLTVLRSLSKPIAR